MNSILDTLETSEAETKDSAIAELNRLAREIATGVEIQDSDHITDLLLNAGMTASQFRELTESIANRIEQQKRLAGLQDLLDEQTRNREAIDEANRILEAAKQEHQQAVNPLAARRHNINDELSTLHTIERELFKSCPDAQLLSEYESATSQFADLDSQRTGCIRTVMESERVAGNLRAELNGTSGPDRRSQLIEQIQKRIAERDEAKAKIENLTKEIEEAEKAAAELRVRMARA